MVLVRGIATQSLYKNRQVVRHDQRNNELFRVRSVVLREAMGYLNWYGVYVAFFMLVLTLKAY